MENENVKSRNKIKNKRSKLYNFIIKYEQKTQVYQIKTQQSCINHES